MAEHLHLHIGSKVNDLDKHTMDISTLLYHKGKLYSGADDGKIKMWSTDMTKLAEVQAHTCSVFSLAASEEHLYSCSNEGTIKTFDLDTLNELKTVARNEKIEYWKLFYSDGFLYSGDNLGNITVWRHGKEIGETNIAEPICDFVVSGNFVFTVKDTDLVVTELHLDKIHWDSEGKRQIQFAIRAAHEGRFPLGVIGKKYVACTNREGKDVIILQNNSHAKFRQFTTIEGNHELVINAIAGTDWKGKTLLFTGGWDKMLRKFRFDGDVVKLDCTSDLGFVINSICMGESGELYAGGSDGNLIRVEIE